MHCGKKKKKHIWEKVLSITEEIREIAYIGEAVNIVLEKETFELKGWEPLKILYIIYQRYNNNNTLLLLLLLYTINKLLN